MLLVFCSTTAWLLLVLQALTQEKLWTDVSVERFRMLSLPGIMPYEKEMWN
jgi:hypothetical protein